MAALVWFWGGGLAGLLVQGFWLWVKKHHLLKVKLGWRNRFFTGLQIDPRSWVEKSRWRKATDKTGESTSYASTKASRNHSRKATRNTRKNTTSFTPPVLHQQQDHNSPPSKTKTTNCNPHHTFLQAFNPKASRSIWRPRCECGGGGSGEVQSIPRGSEVGVGKLSRVALWQCLYLVLPSKARRILDLSSFLVFIFLDFMVKLIAAVGFTQHFLEGLKMIYLDVARAISFGGDFLNLIGFGALEFHFPAIALYIQEWRAFLLFGFLCRLSPDVFECHKLVHLR